MLVSLRGGIQNIQADAAILKIASQKMLAMTRKTRVPERFLRGLSSWKGVIMYAVVQVGSSQFKINEGDEIDADRMEDEKGKDFNLPKVLMFVKDDDIRIGRPFLEDVKVTAKVVKHRSDKKVIAFKYRRRKNSSSKTGHRQKFTVLNITKIQG
jgi:large subunit ribosomal protein L21